MVIIMAPSVAAEEQGQDRAWDQHTSSPTACTVRQGKGQRGRGPRTYNTYIYARTAGGLPDGRSPLLMLMLLGPA